MVCQLGVYLHRLEPFARFGIREAGKEHEQGALLDDGIDSTGNYRVVAWGNFGSSDECPLRD